MRRFMSSGDFFHFLRWRRAGRSVAQVVCAVEDFFDDALVNHALPRQIAYGTRTLVWFEPETFRRKRVHDFLRGFSLTLPNSQKNFFSVHFDSPLASVRTANRRYVSQSLRS